MFRCQQTSRLLNCLACRLAYLLVTPNVEKENLLITLSPDTGSRLQLFRYTLDVFSQWSRMPFPRHEQTDQVPRIQWKLDVSCSLSGPTPFSVQYFSNGYHLKGPRNLPAQSQETMFGSWFCSDPFLWLLVFRRPFLVAIIFLSKFLYNGFWHCLWLQETAALLYCAVAIDWDCSNKLFWYILVWFSFWAMARLFLEFVVQRSPNFQAAVI